MNGLEYNRIITELQRIDTTNVEKKHFETCCVKENKQRRLHDASLRSEKHI